MHFKLKFTGIFVVLLTLLLSPFLAAQASAPAAPAPDMDALDAYLSQQVRANRIPGLVAAVVQGGQTTFLKGYGIDPQAQFLLGSTTKSYTALAVMQLVEAGKLDLDTPVQAYLPWFRVSDPQASARITVRHLLNQTSGMSAPLDPGSERYYPTLEDQARALSDARLNAEPGTRYQYYNQNYRLLGLLVETASGQSYADYLRDHITGPLGLTSTVADPADAPRLAPCYTQVFSFPVRWVQPFHADALPDGYLISTGADSARYLAALMGGGSLDGQQVIRPESLQAMFSTPTGVDSSYGMGWMVLDDPEVGGRFYYHSGAIDCFASMYLMLPEKDLGLVLLYNQNSLFPMFFEQEQIMVGAVSALSGEVPAVGGSNWMGLALGGVALLDLLNHLRLFRGLRRMPAGRKSAWVWLRAVLLEVALPLVVLLFGPQFVASLMGESGGWLDWITVLPDVGIWLLVGLSLTLIRGLLKLGLLLSRRAPAVVIA